MSTAAMLDGLVEELRATRLPSPAVRRRLREEAGLSLRDVARVLGVAPMSVHRWEAGIVKIKRENARHYREFLDALQEVSSS